MGETVNLDENEHAVSMLRGLRQMKHEQDLCDFIIRVQGVEYQVHKNILSVGSPYFKAMLKHGMKECRDRKVEMKNVDPECVKSCIDFLYSGSIDIPDGKIGQLVHVAIMLQLEKVKEAMSDFLSKSLSPDNFYETRAVAEIYDLQTVSKKCMIYFEEYLMAISSQPGFENDEKCDLINILKSRNLKLSEEEKLTISLRWVGENSDRKETLFELIKLIKLKAVPSEYLSDILEKNPVINNELLLHKFINAAYVETLKKANKKTNLESDDSKDRIVLFDESSDCLRSYDSTTEEVTKFHNEKFTHLISFSAVSMDSYIYVLCDDKSFHRLNFRDKNSKWERMRDMIGDFGRRSFVVSLSGSLFVIGGSTGGPRKFVERFDPAANQWLRLKDKPEAISDASLVSLNDSIFCIGGRDRWRELDSFCGFTPSTSEWVDLEPMKKARHGCGAVAVEQRIFVMGGFRDWNPLNEVECYEVIAKHWNSLTPMSDCRGLCVAHHFDDSIFLVGRLQDSDKVEQYDIENDRWCQVKFKGVVPFEIYDSVSIK